MKKILLFISIIIIAGAVFCAWFFPSAFIGSPSQQTVAVQIPESSSVSQIAQILQDKGIITSAWAYRLFSKIDKTTQNAKSGTYNIAPGSSYRDIARFIALGPARDEVTIRLIEGYSLPDLQVEMQEYDVSATSYQDLVGDFANKKPFSAGLRDQYDFLKDLPADATLEGYLFPNTYRVWKDQMPLGLVLKLLNEFQKQTQGFAEKAAEQNRSLHDVVILASIVEKEGKTPEERRMIAGIYLNRIKIGMRLQSDATVNYVTKAGRARPSLDDLEVDSPYNTYQNDGLPPGPICNPGLDALDAALNPTPNDYYYYLHDDEGNVYYARNIEEHKANRYKAYGE